MKRIKLPITGIPYVVMAVVLTGCFVVRPSVPAGYASWNEITEEYRVYSAVLRNQAADSTLVISDSTGAMWFGAGCGSENRLRPGFCPEGSGEAWADLDRKDAMRRPMRTLFDKDIRIVLQRDGVRVTPDCHGPNIVSLSRVGFNRNRSVAALAVTYTTGKGPFPGCGVITGSTMILSREGKTWRIVGSGGGFIT